MRTNQFSYSAYLTILWESFPCFLFVMLYLCLLWPCMRCHMDLTQTSVLCRCVYGVQLARHMSELCLPNCMYITITTVTMWHFTDGHFELYWIALPLCSGALVPSLVCVYMPHMCSLYCQLHPLLTYMDRFDVVLTLVSLVCHCMWCTGTYVTLIWLHTGIYLCVVGTEIEVEIESLELPWVTHKRTLPISSTCSSAASRLHHDKHNPRRGGGGGTEPFSC